jgi:hypothetical protein
MINVQLRNAKKVMVVGVLLSLIFGLVPFESLSLKESWRSGISPFYVSFGLILTLLGYFHYRGSRRAKWFIVFWCPILFSTGALFIALQDIKNIKLAEVLFGGGPISIIWMSIIYFSLVYRDKK